MCAKILLGRCLSLARLYLFQRIFQKTRLLQSLFSVFRKHMFLIAVSFQIGDSHLHTCQVRVVGLLGFMSAGVLLVLRVVLNCEPRPIAFPAGPQLRGSCGSPAGPQPARVAWVPRRTSTARVTWLSSPPDLNREGRVAGFPAGPQRRASAGSVPRRTSTATHDHGNMLLTMAWKQTIKMSWWGSLEVDYIISTYF